MVQGPPRHSENCRVPLSRSVEAFSLVEILVALAIILVLIASLLPALISQGIAAGYTAECASNLRQITMARVAYRNDHRENVYAGSWDSLVPYGDGVRSMVICPADDAAIGGSADDFKIGISTSGGPEGTITYYLPFAESPFNVRMSQEQYEQVAWGSQEGRNFFDSNPWYTGYEPGDNPDLYYIIFEDIVHNGQAAGDQDFEDIKFRLKVENGYTQVEAKRGQAGYRHYLQDERGNNLIGSGQAIPLEWVTVTVPQGISSYGMNRESEKLEETMPKIFAIDYELTIVQPETWNDWDDEHGQAGFARHNGRVNGVRLDGGIHRWFPSEIDPGNLSLEALLWRP